MLKNDQGAVALEPFQHTGHGELHDVGDLDRAELAAYLARGESLAVDVDVEEAGAQVVHLLRRERDLKVGEVARRQVEDGRGALAALRGGVQVRVAGSLGSGAFPSSAPSIMAASVTVFAIGPAVS